jgi:hypothetical protein
MKVILKGGVDNFKIGEFFYNNILPILDFGIAIELSDRVITVYEKKDGSVVEYTDPTAEVIVELLPETISLAKEGKVSEEVLREKASEFFDEAMAIRKIEELKRDFSVEYYSCRYSPASS